LPELQERKDMPDPILSNFAMRVSKIVAGSNVTLTPDSGLGDVTISSSDGNGSGGGGAVSRIIAGSNVTVSPTSGLGDVTISATGTGGGGVPGVTVILPSGDNTGYQDRQNIQNAIAKGAFIQLVNGIYYVGGGNQAIQMNQPCIIRGLGEGTIIQNEGTSNNVFVMNYIDVVNWPLNPGYSGTMSTGEISYLRIIQDPAVTHGSGYMFVLGADSPPFSFTGVVQLTMNATISDTFGEKLWGGLRVANNAMGCWIHHNKWSNMRGGGAVWYDTDYGPGDNVIAFNYFHDRNTGIVIGGSDTTWYVCNKLNGEGVVFRGNKLAKSIQFIGMSVEGVYTMIDFGTGIPPQWIQWLGGEANVTDGPVFKGTVNGFAYQFLNTNNDNSLTNSPNDLPMGPLMGGWPGTGSGGGNFSAQTLTATGASSPAVAGPNRGIVDYLYGARFLAMGPDAATQGSIGLYGCSSDFSLNTNYLSLTPEGATFSGTITLNDAVQVIQPGPLSLPGDLYLNPNGGNVQIGSASGPANSLIVHGNLYINGVKSFRIAHPLDPKKHLTHAVIEGPESAVFYRGEAETDATGFVEITLPDYFEALVSSGDRSIQLTPFFEDTGEGLSFQQLAASRVVNGKFRVRSSNPQPQKFYWEVKAVRSDVPPLEVVTDVP
jgi:hypothetical protein